MKSVLAVVALTAAVMMVMAIEATLSIATAVTASTTGMENLIAKANIYYQRPLRLGQPRELRLDEVTMLDTKTNIKVIIHGFISSRTHVSIRPLGNAYLAQGADNIFLADWEDAAGLDYPTSRLAVGKVAEHFGKLLNDFIIKHDIDRSEVHVIGHSLGAHIAGDMGKYFNGTLGRVTGLDPALPLFTSHAGDSLRPSDARFVDVIHTDYPVFGDLTPRGSVDFYPNFGYTPQKGCEDVNFLTANSCSHNRAVILYAESIELPNNFPSLRCSFVAVKARDRNACATQQKSTEPEPIVIYMGENVSKEARGNFFLETYDAPPYGMGMNSELQRTAIQ